jgi:hypothetical protein
MLFKYLDGLDALVDSRGVNAEHEVARRFVQGACELTDQIARMTDPTINNDGFDSVYTLKGLIDKAKALAAGRTVEPVP